MCRMLGVISSSDASAAPWLLEAPISLLRQADVDRTRRQGDGWGIAWYPTGALTPQVEKGVQAPYEARERERFSTAARTARGAVVVGHLRDASNPLGLPREHLVGLANTQPFLGDGAIFAHNGWIPFPRETLARLGGRSAQVRGVNDSEVLQQLFLSSLAETAGDPPAAFSRSVGVLREVWESQGSPTDGPHGGPHGGLNLLFAPSPGELWAFAYFSLEHGSCLSGLPRPYYEMSYREEPGRVIVSSEPTDREIAHWRPLRSGEFLRLERQHDGIRRQHERVRRLPSFPTHEPSEPPRDPIPAT